MKTLILYATKYGATESCAKLLAQNLEGEVQIANVKQAKGIDIRKYDRVILGSSIYVGQVNKQLKEFTITNLEVLRTKETGAFLCCMEEGEAAEAQMINGFPNELLDKAKAKDYFGGEFRFNKMNFFERFAIKKITKSKTGSSVDTKKDLSTISEAKIVDFAKRMNASA